MGSTTGDAYSESLEVIKKIKEAWENGHTLVPLLGAGISVDSGMPLVDSIMLYLVMIRQYVKLRAYRPQYEAVPYGDIDEEYQRHPIHYIRHYGWPDRFQLRHELMLQYSKIDPSQYQELTAKISGKTFDEWIAQELDNEVSSLKKWQKEQYEALLNELHKHTKDFTPRSTWEILGDWRAVIRDFTEFTVDDADSLFERLYRWHKPGRSHHFWAFLTRLMGLRLFLTTNFDNLLERAFIEQGIDHRVFGVEHGDNLPHESLVRETVSVIKLHGDTHQLLIDEKLDYPPGPDYLQRLQACMPKRPILIVMGCGGNDPRTLEVVRHHARKNHVKGIPGVIWLHFEQGTRGQRTLEAELGENIKHARVTNPGLFLSHLYACLRSQHPASRVPYQTHLLQSIAPLNCGAPDSSSVFDSSSIKVYKNDKANVFLYKQCKTDPNGQQASASQLMADFVYERKTRGKYTPIWINLEAHHSVVSVVQQIVEQCLVHDTFISPFDVPASKAGQDPEAALTAERLFHILGRGRYVLAFDALQAFLWPPIAHHGASEEQEDVPEIERLFTLLKKLMTHEKLQDKKIDVVLCASFDSPKGRRGIETGSQLFKYFSSLVAAVNSISRSEGSGREDLRKEGPCSETPDSEDPGSDCNNGPTTKASGELFVVSCFRRPRSLVSLQRVFLSIFGHKSSDAELEIDRLVKDGHLLPVEGGFFRMRRSERDDVYNRHSKGTSVREIRAALKEGGTDRLIELIQKCYALASTHGLIARCYYSDSYLHSFDSWIFLEYFYHRISSIRYITKLVVLLETAEGLGLMDRKLLSTIPPAPIIERAKRNTEYTLQKIQEYVVGERIALLQSLKPALIQAKDHLLHGLPAAQLEAWCKGVLCDSFAFSVDSTSEALDLTKCRLAKQLYGGRAADTAQVTNDVIGIFWTLLGLLRRSLYEQGRYEDAREVAWVQIVHKAGQLRSPLPSTRDAKDILDWLCSSDGKDDAKEECIQSLLDFLARHPDARNQITKVQKYYNALPPSTLLGKQNQLRALCMLAEASTERSGERFDACVRCEASEPEATECNERLALIEKGLDLCRVLSPEAARDSSHDLYSLRFRARLLMAKARIQWLGATEHEPFREADWLLESARANLSSDDHARLARLEMTWAEGLLLQANLSLNKPCDKAETDSASAVREQALASARVDYLRAGDSLQRAREHLTRGRRDVELWASYQQLWAQYQAEWCLFHLAHLEGQLRNLEGDNQYKHKRALAELAPRDTAALLKRLKRGLNGLQAGMVIKPRGNEDSGLRRIWLELLCAGMVYGVTTAAGTSCYEDLLPKSSRPWPLGIDKFWEHWCLMNERAGIPTTIELGGKYHNYLKQRVQDPSDDIGRWRVEMITKLCKPSPEVSVLRKRALSIAKDLYNGDDDDFPPTLTGGIIKLI